MRGQAVTKKDRGGRVIFTFVSFVGRFQERKERRQGDKKEEGGGEEGPRFLSPQRVSPKLFLLTSVVS